jgi:nucleotide-binding universal stress UspA family protein
MYDRILVPIDGSKFSEQAIPYARLLREKLGSSIELIQVLEEPSPIPSNPSYSSYLEHVADSLRAESDSYLSELVESLRASGTAASWSVHTGDPASVIAKIGDSHPSSLIAMCSHGRSGEARWWLGSTTDKVIHAANCPVLVVRSRSEYVESPRVGLTHCTVPLDGSSRAEQVLAHVVTWATAFSLQVTLIRVIPELDSHMLELFPEPFEEDRESQARQYLESVSERLAEQGISNIQVSLLHGHPASVLVDLALHATGNLMIMGTQGLGASGIYRWTMGSVSQRVVGNSQAPVLVIRTAEERPAQ